ncbi:MAG: hypothetical protein ACRD27_06390, partial [Terracidiphilus sp.]
MDETLAAAFTGAAVLWVLAAAAGAAAGFFASGFFVSVFFVSGTALTPAGAALTCVFLTGAGLAALGGLAAGTVSLVAGAPFCTGVVAAGAGVVFPALCSVLSGTETGA